MKAAIIVHNTQINYEENLFEKFKLSDFNWSQANKINSSTAILFMWLNIEN